MHVRLHDLICDALERWEGLAFGGLNPPHNGQTREEALRAVVDEIRALEALEDAGHVFYPQEQP